MVLLGGTFAALTLPKESNPEIKVPYASIATFYPGASPLDVEDLITYPIEDAVLGLEDLKNLSSSSSEGFSLVFAEFEADADIEDRVRELQDAVSQMESTLPDDAQAPMVTELNFSNSPILVLSISADVPHAQLADMAETLQDEILEVNGVGDATLTGVRPMEISMEIDPSKLEQYGISILEVYQVVQSAEATLPLGSIEAGGKNYSLRFSAPVERTDLGGLIVRSVGDSFIYLRDLADISYGLVEETQYARVSFEGSDSLDSISMNVTKKTGGDIIKMVDEINDKIEELEATTLNGATVTTTYDSAQDIKDQLNDLSRSGAMTIVLVAIILLLALGWREAIVASLAIPFTFLITFMGFGLMGTTINFLSLFSLILALGILVDTGVVITEGMHTRLAEGKNPREVALATVRDYQWPLISGTMTTVAAFVPMLFMTGIIGEFVKHIPRTVSLALLASLFVGLGFLPVMGSRILKVKKEKKKSWFERRIVNIRNSYRSTLEWLLSRKYRQSLLMFFMLILFGASLVLPGAGLLKVTMFSEADYRLFFIEVDLPNGSLLSETDAVVRQVEEALLEIPEVQSYLVTVGTSGNLSDGLAVTSGGNSNLASFTVNLYEDREVSSLDIIDDLREELSVITEGNVEVQGVSDGPPTANPIEFRIYGDDLDELTAYSEAASVVLAETDGVVNISSSLDDSNSEFVLSVDRERAGTLGLSPLSLAQIAQISLNGITATSLTINGDDTNVILKTSAGSTLEEVLALPILTQFGTFPLSHFVNVDLGQAPASVLHTDGDRTVTISADLEADYLVNDVLADFQDSWTPQLLPGYRVEYGGELEEQVESFKSLGTAMIYGVLLILMILVLQFNSLKQTAIVLFTIPLALIGVFAGLTLTSIPFSFPAFIGVVALTGIVVNNAIILIDRINKNTANGMAQKEAILDAGVARFQPIILTSLTTIVGIFPLATSDETWGPLGFSIIYGLAFSTILTLVVIPSAYQRLIRG